MAVVVDTNVAMVASGRAPQADLLCVATCLKRLAAIKESGGLLVDDSGHILHEYAKNLGHSGQPGAGEAFAKWAHDHQADPSMVRRVVISRTVNAGWREYNEFPDHPALQGFDRSDQKFVAVALSSGMSPPILHALDRGWWRHRQELAGVGVTVESLCPQHAPPA